jgi:methyl coenzyme M reductase subunit D
MDEMNLRVSLRGARCGMDVVAAKVSSKVERFLDRDVCKVLVAESFDILAGSILKATSTLTDDFLLGDKQGEFIFSLVRQLAKLDTSNFGPNVGGQIRHFSTLEKVWESWISILSVLIMLKEFKWGVSS